MILEKRTSAEEVTRNPQEVAGEQSGTTQFSDVYLLTDIGGNEVTVISWVLLSVK